MLASLMPADAGWDVGFREGLTADVACLERFEAVGEKVGFCRQIVGGHGCGVVLYSWRRRCKRVLWYCDFDTSRCVIASGG